MLRISYTIAPKPEYNWLQAETRDAAVGFYTKHFKRHSMEKLWWLVKNNEDIDEPCGYDIIMDWYDRTVEHTKESIEKREVDAIKNARYGYKSVPELSVNNNPSVWKGPVFDKHRMCPKCGNWMATNVVEEYVPDNCSYGCDTKRVVIGRSFRCCECGHTEYEKADDSR